MSGDCDDHRAGYAPGEGPGDAPAAPADPFAPSQAALAGFPDDLLWFVVTRLVDGRVAATRVFRARSAVSVLHGVVSAAGHFPDLLPDSPLTRRLLTDFPEPQPEAEALLRASESGTPLDGIGTLDVRRVAPAYPVW